MEIDLELKVKLFNEYLENGGVERINFPDLLKDLMKVKSLPNGKVDPNTVSSLVNSAMLAYLGSQLMEPFMSDKRLSQYETLTQKSIFFNQINVETEKEFDEIFEKYNNRQDILFRGLNEAKFRLYSSLQRNWIGDNLYEKHGSFPKFLETLIENARNEQGNVLMKYLENTGFDSKNDLAVLSFLQHYGCPTPLLDWTYSFANALYFATEKIHPQRSKWEIEKYFCVYFLEEKYLSSNSLKEIAETGLIEKRDVFRKEMHESMKSKGYTQEQIEKTFPDKYIKELFVLFKGRGAITYLTKIERLMISPILYFSDFKKDFKIHYYLNNNMNIVNQQGVFTWNSHPTRPLEHVANEEYKKANPKKDYRFSECININKNLANYIITKIKSHGITKDFIYPDPYSIAKQSFEKTK